jgi:cell shape-determining protein MreC
VLELKCCVCVIRLEETNGIPSQWHFLVFVDKQKENEKLRESLSKKAASLQYLQQEYAGVKEENERLQKDISEKERHNQQLDWELGR